MDPDKSWTHGTMWAKTLRLKLSRKKNQIRGGRNDFPAREKMLEGGGRELQLISTMSMSHMSMYKG